MPDRMTSAAPWHSRALAGDPALTWHDPEPLRTADVPGASARGIRVVLLHGVTRCGRDFEPLVASLTATHEGNTVDGHGPRLAVLDQRGHGDSSRASRYLVTDYAADAARFIDAHGPCVVVGHSLGAMVAAHVAARLPALVRGAVLIDPPFHGMGERIGGSTWEALFVGLREARRRGGGVPALAAAIAEIRLPAGARTVRLGDVRDATALSWHAECLSRLDPEVLTPVIEGRWLEGYDPTAVAAAIRCPLVLVQADPACGGALDDAEAAAFASAAPTCDLARVSGAGHALHREHPARLAATVRDLIGRLP
jgi:pimeloyl-ACP methyl ester carboxylesterase